MEEFRIWNDVRSITEIQDNMFKILNGSESNLLVYYKFDDMYGTSLYDETTNSNNGSLFNTSDDSWVTSTTPAGTYGKSVRTSVAATSGSAGKTITAQITSTVSNTNYLGIYSTGNGDGKVTSEDFGASGATQRSNIIWGVEEYGACTADMTFTYANITGYSSNESALKLLKRNDAASAWADVTGPANQSTINHTFTLSGVTDYSEFSIGDGGTNPLPVELSSFAANIADGKVILDWQTATEVNNYGFEIQRSVVSGQPSVISDQLLEWKVIGFVNGHGNSNSPKDYSFTDNLLNLNLSLNLNYRLKQIDNDGKYSYSAEINIKVENIPTEFALFQNYPNPFNPSTIISFQLPVKSNVSLKVYDVLGNEVITLVDEEKPAGNYKINFNLQQTTNQAQLTSGVYYYQLRADGFVQTKKMLYLK